MTIKIRKFKFDKCSNHYFSGCQNPPGLIYKHKEMCSFCHSKEVYEDLAFGIKYGKYKNLYKLRASKLTAFEKEKS